MTISRQYIAIAVAAALLTGSAAWTIQNEASLPIDGDPVMPSYDDDGNLLLPADYRQWRFVGSSLGMSYTEGTPSHEMFHHTLMEPTAYDHFSRTGAFREGTMFVLMLHGTGDGELPQRRGRFAAEIHGIEMAVKDSTHADETWDYYNFGGMDGVRDRVQAMSANTCHACHSEHARRDNVFTQFYPLLEDAAPHAAAAAAPTPTPTAAPVAADADQPTPAVAPLAVKGLDPVMLVDGREELGKPEIEMSHEGHRYQFVSEPTRARFEADPDRYSIRNDACLVVPSAEPDPDLFVVYEGRIYGFATAGCIESFVAGPSDYLESQE